MEQNKTRTYLKYAVGEVALVMIGILLALQVNNWNENRRSNQTQQLTLKNLETELQEAKSYLKIRNEGNRKILKNSDLYIYNEFDKDSLESDPGATLSFTNYYTIDVKLPIVERELGSDPLIKGEGKLVTKLREIKNQSDGIETTLFYLDEFWNNQVAPYYLKEKVLVLLHQLVKSEENNMGYRRTNDGALREAPKFSSLEKVYNDEEHRNLAAMCNLFTSELTVVAEEMVTNIDEAIALIKEIE